MFKPGLSAKKFLSLESIATHFSRLARSYDELPEAAKKCVHPMHAEQEVVDYATCLQNGWRWMFEGLKHHQPAAFRALELRDPSLLYAEGFYPHRLSATDLIWTCKGFVQIDDSYFVFHPDFFGGRIEQLWNDHPAIDRYNALPEAIAAAYYARMEGLEVVHRLPSSPMSNRALPAGIMRAWRPAGDLCREGRKARADMGAALRGVSENSDASVETLTDAFCILLDTRPQDDFGAEGDFLLVDQTSRSQRIYHIRDSDFSTLSVVKEPVGAIDEYVAHVFSGIEGRFDFKPYLQYD